MFVPFWCAILDNQFSQRCHMSRILLLFDIYVGLCLYLMVFVFIEQLWYGSFIYRL